MRLKVPLVILRTALKSMGSKRALSQLEYDQPRTLQELIKNCEALEQNDKPKNNHE